MNSVEPLTPDLFHELYETFLASDDPRVSREAWHGLFLGCGRLDGGAGYVLVDCGRQCHVVFSRVELSHPSYCYVHHVSDVEFFVQHHAPIRRALARETGVRLAATDRRALRGARLPLALDLPWKTRQLYRAQVAEPHEIDTLYSEIALLNLSTLPRVRSLLAKRLGLAPAQNGGAHAD